MGKVRSRTERLTCSACTETAPPDLRLGPRRQGTAETHVRVPRPRRRTWEGPRLLVKSQRLLGWERVSGQRSEVREAFRASRKLTGLPLLLMLAKQNGDRLVNGTGGRMVRLPPPHPPPSTARKKGKSTATLIGDTTFKGQVAFTTI